MEEAPTDVFCGDAGTGPVHNNKNASEESPMECRVIYVLGGPGSGKTTQCTMLSSELGIAHLSAGDLLQHEIDSCSPNGRMMQAMWKTKNKTTFLFDGFPRNIENLRAAENIMKMEPELVLFLNCSEPKSTRRLLNRNQGRVDDNPDTIRKRREVYNESTLPVIDYYRSRGKLLKIYGERPIEKVHESVKEIIISHNIK